MDCSPPNSSVRGFSRQEYRSGLPFPTPGTLPNPGICISCIGRWISTTEPPGKPSFKVALLKTEILESKSPYGHVMTQLPSDLQMQYDQPF